MNCENCYLNKICDGEICINDNEEVIEKHFKNVMKNNNKYSHVFKIQSFTENLQINIIKNLYL